MGFDDFGGRGGGGGGRGGGRGGLGRAGRWGYRGGGWGGLYGPYFDGVLPPIDPRIEAVADDIDEENDEDLADGLTP